MLPIQSILEKINPSGKTVMNLGDPYLCLVFGEKQVKSAIWYADSGETSFGSAEQWGGESTEELIVAADASIATAVAGLSQVSNRQPSKVIFGLPENWVEEDSVIKEKAEILQTVCRKLTLKSIGFMVTPEAVAHFLKKNEGGLPSLILLSIEETEIIVSLINQGKFLGSKVVSRSNSLPLDLEEGLLRFNFEGNFPSRILLFPGKSAEIDRQVLIAYPWTGGHEEKKLKFLQLPKVEIAPEDIEVSAVISSGKKELGFSIEEQPQFSPPASPSLVADKIVTEIAEEEPKVELLPVADFGFVENEDVAQKENLNNITQPEVFLSEENEVKEGEVVVSETPKENLTAKFIKFRPPKFNLSFIFQPIVWFFHFIASLFAKKSVWFLLGLPLLFLAIVAVSFLQLAKCEIKLFTRPQRIEKEIEFTLDKEIKEADADKQMLPLREVVVEVSGSKTAGVNGKKVVGDKAKGEVIIYNRTEQSKTLAKGTAVIGQNLKFILNDEVKIASKTADLERGADKWGETKAAVTAADIGGQYNLAANSSLTIEGLSSSAILVKNQNAFSGGTSREIQAVSKEDQESLRKALLSELEEKAKNGAKGKITEDDYLLVESMTVRDKVDKFDKEVGAEAASLSLEAKGSFVFNYFRRSDLKTLTQKTVVPLVQSGFQKDFSIKEENITAKDKSKNKYVLKFKVEILPEINTAEIVGQVKGKSIAFGRQYLRKIDKIEGMDILISPKIFGKIEFFPFRQKNIKVTLEAI